MVGSKFLNDLESGDPSVIRLRGVPADVAEALLRFLNELEGVSETRADTIDNLSRAARNTERTAKGADSSSGSAESMRSLNRTERRILALCRRKAYKGETIAYHVGLAYTGHIRRVLSQLVKEGRLRVTEGGYRTVSRATGTRRCAT